jgi:hypothetical protein
LIATVAAPHISEIMAFLRRVWEWLQSASPAPLVTVEIALVGLIVSWMQLRYAQRRDRAIDIRNSWAKTHKLMTIFRFKRELLIHPNQTYPASADIAIAALESLHLLKAQLDRMPDGQLVEEIADFLHTNWEAEIWRSDAFEKLFDEYVKQAARLATNNAVIGVGQCKSGRI